MEPQDKPLAPNNDFGVDGNLKIGKRDVAREIFTQGAHRAISQIIGKARRHSPCDHGNGKDHQKKHAAND
jgi:hypothetical protein